MPVSLRAPLANPYLRSESAHQPKILGMKYTDVWGPSNTPTRQGHKYFITFTDDATRYTVTFLMRTKDKALKAYKSYEAWALAQQHCKAIKVLHSNQGGEYLSKAFDQHLAAAGTARKLTVHDTPHLNGMAERLNRTLLERICAFAHTSGLPKTLWGEGLRHATWLKKRTATHALDGKMPFKVLFGVPPDLSGLRLWGCPIWVHNAAGSKLDAQACQGRWIGLDIDTRAHHIYWPGNGNVTVERNIYFGSSAQLEGERMQVPSENGKSTATLTTPTMPKPPAMPEPPATPQTPARAHMPSPPPALRHSQRIRKPLQRVRDIIEA
jgi:transposase InsO family protein